MRKRIALFLMNVSTEHQVYMETTARAMAERHNLELEVTHSADGGGQENPIRHIAQVFQSLRPVDGGRIPDAILIQPMSANCPSVVEAAARIRVPCVVLNRLPEFLPEMRQRFPEVPLFSVSPNHRTIGRVQGQQFRALLPRGGRLLYVQGIEIATATQERREGMIETIAGLGIEVVPLYGDWNSQMAEEVVWNWLDRLRPGEKLPDLYGCQNDGMAEGARRALERLAERCGDPHLLDRPFTGCDGTPNHGQRLVREGILAATVTRGSASATAIEALAAYFEHGVFPPPYLEMPVSSLPPVAMLAQRVSASAS